MGKKIITILATALLFTFGVSVCGGHSYGNTADAAAANCKDGVCEIVPAANDSGGERSTRAAINPYNSAVPDIEGQWESDVKQLGPHDIFVAAQSDPLAGVVFSVSNPVKDFKVLSLQFKDIGNNGKPVFQVKELYTKPVFLPERKLLVKFVFFGSIPNNGISYKDKTGKTRCYSVSQSGMDGSLEFIEF